LARLTSKTGYSLIELVVVIFIIGIITSIAIRSLRSTNETARIEETKKELDQLARAVAGDPQLVSGGVRTDFGYVGDVGSMPPNLDALVSNIGYATWNGPYVHDDFYPQVTSSETEFKIDAWGIGYTYTGGVTITSQGGGTSITREIAPSLEHLLRNKVSAVVTDLDNTPPGETYKDSVTFLLTYPNGSGSMITRTRCPAADGFVRFDSIPIGSHLMQVVYTPANDTLTHMVNVEPGRDCYTTVSLYDNLW
jgi:prepilin-type N-terminal cleavage/methylation domain-containing protein